MTDYDDERHARRKDPHTSHDAAADVDVERIENRILSAIESSGDRGMILDEIIKATGIQKVSVSPTLRPMVRKGMLLEPDEDDIGDAGKAQLVWKVNPDYEPTQPVTNRSKNKGDEGEREAQALLRDLLGDDPDDPRIRRALGAGRKDDVGDIDGVPSTAIQVVWTKTWTQAINKKLPEVEQQRKNKRARFASLWVRRDRNPIPWIVVMTPTQWVRLHKYAMIGMKAEIRRKRALEQGD